MEFPAGSIVFGKNTGLNSEGHEISDDLLTKEQKEELAKLSCRINCNCFPCEIKRRLKAMTQHEIKQGRIVLGLPKYL